MIAIRPLFLAACAAASLWLSACAAEPAPQACNPVDFDGVPFTVCSFDVDRADIRLFLTHPDGAPYAQFDRLAGQLEADGTSLRFAMNGGMYHDDRRAVGLYVEDGKQAAPLVTSAGPGNFGMLPNGVFWLDRGEAGITETRTYDALFPASPPRFATQSGPMLVLDGALHPDFNADGPSRKRRNGVGSAMGSAHRTRSTSMASSRASMRRRYSATSRGLISAPSSQSSLRRRTRPDTFRSRSKPMVG